MDQENFPQPQVPEPIPSQEKSKTWNKKMYMIPLAFVVLVVAYFVSAYYFSFWPFVKNHQLQVSESEYSLPLINGWKIYTDKKLGFSFQYPEEFYDIKTNRSSVNLVRKPQESENLGLNDQISVSVSDKNDGPIEKSLGGISSFVNPSAFEKQNIKVGDQNVTVLSYSETKDGQKQTLIKIYAFEYSGRIYSIMVPDVLSENIIKTFQFYEPVSSKSLKDILWKTFKFETYGFEFKLPEDWEQTEPDSELKNNDNIILSFSPSGGEYGTRPENYKLEIILSNSQKDITTDLSESEKRGLEKITINGKSAWLIYEQPEFKGDPLAFVQLEGKSLAIIPGKESEFSYTDSFKELLSTFKFFEPYGTTNSSQPFTKDKIADKGAWCSNAPEQGHCFAEIARTEQNVQASWCAEITPENSGERAGNKGFYYFYKNSCYKYVAPKLKDISLCDKMEGSGQFENNKTIAIRDCKGWVNYELALQNSDVSYCNKVDKDVWVNDGYGMDTISQLDCFVAVAVKMNDQKICDQIIYSKTATGGTISKEWCYYNYAVEKKDCSLVPPNSPAPKSQCESFVKNGI